MTRVHHKYEGVYLFLVVPWGCLTCADPEIDLGGGRGVQARRPENSLDNFFLNPQLILQIAEGVQWFYYIGNTTFPRIQRGSNILQGGGPTFSKGGPNAYFYLNPYNL